MIISYFEEFPDYKSLSKIKSITTPTKLYIAARSLAEFNQLKTQIRSKNVREIIYWPILEKKEGYWISPFSHHTALKRILDELNGQTISVMLDLELPTTRNPWLFLTQFPFFYSNKLRISNFIDTYNGKLYLCEYYGQRSIHKKIFRILGLHYYAPHAYIIKMYYQSIHQFSHQFLEDQIKRGKHTWGNNFILALGTIAKGIHGTEPRLTPEELAKNLNEAKRHDIEEVIIFRLGGIDEDYNDVLNAI